MRIKVSKALKDLFISLMNPKTNIVQVPNDLQMQASIAAKYNCDLFAFGHWNSQNVSFILKKKPAKGKKVWNGKNYISFVFDELF